MPTKSNNDKKKEAEAAGRAPKKTKQQVHCALLALHLNIAAKSSRPCACLGTGECWQERDPEEGRAKGSQGRQGRQELERLSWGTICNVPSFLLIQAQETCRQPSQREREIMWCRKYHIKR